MMKCVRLSNIAPVVVSLLASLLAASAASATEEPAYREHKWRLRSALANQGYEVAGPPEWARYDAPFIPWFRRRNEVLDPVR